MPDMTAADPAALPPRADLERRLREQTAELEGVYANAPVGLCVLDRDLHWVRINKLLADMNGFPPEAHIGRSVRELLPDLADQAERILRGVLDAGAALRDQMIIGETPSRPGERRVWIEHFYPLRDATQACGMSPRKCASRGSRITTSAHWFQPAGRWSA